MFFFDQELPGRESLTKASANAFLTKLAQLTSLASENLEVLKAVTKARGSSWEANQCWRLPLHFLNRNFSLWDSLNDICYEQTWAAAKTRTTSMWHYSWMFIRFQPSGASSTSHVNIHLLINLNWLRLSEHFIPGRFWSLHWHSYRSWTQLS